MNLWLSGASFSIASFYIKIWSEQVNTSRTGRVQKEKSTPPNPLFFGSYKAGPYQLSVASYLF